MVAGSEAMAFGILVFVFGSLLVFNAWAVVDAKMGASAAARESARVFVESGGDPASAERAGRAAFEGSTSLASDDLDLRFEGTFARCSRISVTATYAVPAIRLPFGGWGTAFDVAATHSEIVDPYRSGLAGVARCG